MKRFLLALLLCLFASSTANAECAWVLWKRASKDVIRKDGKWELQRAFPTYQQCQEYKYEEIDGTGENFKRIKSWEVTINRGVNIILSDPIKNEFTLLEYSCFPDTIDPRK
jgi:hypothetical protein